MKQLRESNNWRVNISGVLLILGVKTSWQPRPCQYPVALLCSSLVSGIVRKKKRKTFFFLKATGRVCARSSYSPPVSLVLLGRACTSISRSKKGWQNHVLLLSQVFALAQLWLYKYLWPFHVGGQTRRFNTWCAIPTPLEKKRWSTDPQPHVCFHAQTPLCWGCFSNKQTKKDHRWQDFSW